MAMAEHGGKILAKLTQPSRVTSFYIKISNYYYFFSFLSIKQLTFFSIIFQPCKEAPTVNSRPFSFNPRYVCLFLVWWPGFEHLPCITSRNQIQVSPLVCLQQSIVFLEHLNQGVTTKSQYMRWCERRSPNPDRYMLCTWTN